MELLPESRAQVVVPILTILGLSFQEAVGSSLLVDVITTTIVIYTYMKKKSASVTIALMMGLGAVLGAQIGARIAVSVDQLPLEILFIALTVIMGYHAFRRSVCFRLFRFDSEHPSGPQVAVLSRLPVFPWGAEAVHYFRFLQC